MENFLLLTESLTTSRSQKTDSPQNNEDQNHENMIIAASTEYSSFLDSYTSLNKLTIMMII